MTTSNIMPELLILIAKEDMYEHIFWTTNLEFFIKCSDFFHWACADLVEIESHEDVDMLAQCIREAGEDGCLLYCARRRKMRPMPHEYKNLDKKNWALFDACGPERKEEL
jgi:hypothetical protein